MKIAPGGFKFLFVGCVFPIHVIQQNTNCRSFNVDLFLGALTDIKCQSEINICIHCVCRTDHCIKVNAFLFCFERPVKNEFVYFLE